MRFRAAHKLTSYLLVAAALTTVLSAGTLPIPGLAVFVLAVVLSWNAEPNQRLGMVMTKLNTFVTAATTVFFAVTVVRIVRSFPEPDLSPLLDLVLFLLAAKLLQRRSNRDYLQVYVLSFLLVLAGAWLAQSAIFAVGFSAYVVLATWTLILFHLRREIEDNYLVKHSSDVSAEKVTVARVLDSRRVVGRSFFLATGGAATAVLVGSTAVFVLAPRIGIGFFSGGLRRRANVVGFTDDVALGQHGVLSNDNETVVLRVSVPSISALSERTRDETIAGLYWRGTVYDVYQDGHWLRSGLPDTRTRLRVSPLSSGANQVFVAATGADPVSLAHERAQLALAERQVIQVVGLAQPVAFALDRPLAFEFSAPSLGSFTRVTLEGRYSGETALNVGRMLPSGQVIPVSEYAGAQYTAYSRLTPTGGSGQIGPTPTLTQGFLQAYLSVPGSLSPRMAELARTLTADRPAPAGKVQAILDWLHRTHKYTTTLQRDPRIADPLEDFLFQQKAGHCEYFASAAVILMRLAGVPARYVNGFLGGEWNDLQKHITVRDNRAHSWAEAYIPGFGWLRVDATPPAAQTSHMSRLQQLSDSLEAFWSRWVIDYDAGRQVELARRLAGGFGRRRTTQSRLAWPHPSPRQVGIGLTAAAVGLAFVRAALRHRRRVGRGEAPRGRGMAMPLKHYERAVALLAASGLVRNPSETPREFSARVSAEAELGGAGSAAFVTLTRAYERARYAQISPTPQELALLGEAADRVRRAIRERGTPHRRAHAA